MEIKRGRNLAAMDRNVGKLGRKTSSDPFVKVYGGKEYLGKTGVEECTLNPTWNEKFQLVLGADDANFILSKKGAVKMEFRLFDYDRHKEHDSMGVVKVPLKCLEPPSTKWYKVTQGKGKYFCKDASGEIEITMAVSARKMLSLVRGNNHILEFNDIRIGLGWDVEANGKTIDLDTSCVALDKKGNILMNETVYYGNTTNSNLSIMHSGDDRDGKGEMNGGDDEVIICHLDKLPPRIKVLYFLLTVATPDSTFANVKSAKVRVVEAERKLGIVSFEPHDFGAYTAMFLMRLAKNTQKQWVLSIIEDTDPHARDFGSLIPELKGYTRDIYPAIQIDPDERVAVMRKGSTIHIGDYVRNSKIPKWVTFGLTWDVTDGVNIDLDASAICLGKDLRPLDIIFFKQLRSKDGSVRHSGDEREGDEMGDDERINVSLPNTSPDIHYIAFVINSYSGKCSCHCVCVYNIDRH